MVKFIPSRPASQCNRVDAPEASRLPERRSTDDAALAVLARRFGDAAARAGLTVPALAS